MEIFEKFLPLEICLATLAKLFTFTATRSDNLRFESANKDLAACGQVLDIFFVIINIFSLFTFSLSENNTYIEIIIWALL